MALFGTSVIASIVPFTSVSNAASPVSISDYSEVPVLIHILFAALTLQTAAPPDDKTPTSVATTESASVTPPHLPIKTDEFGLWSGISLHSGHIFGFEKHVREANLDLRYSHLILMKRKWDLRYSPEVTALSVIDELDPERPGHRRKIFGSGLSPVGFQLNIRPTHKFQPFATTNGGFLYYSDRVLAPDASQFMWTIDLGGGIQFFQTATHSLSLGYRYRHMSNANISHSNPGTDTNTFFFGFSHFRAH